MKHTRSTGIRSGEGRAVRITAAFTLGPVLAVVAAACSSGQSSTTGCATNPDAGGAHHPGGGNDAGTPGMGLGDGATGGQDARVTGDAGPGASADGGDGGPTTGLLATPSNVPSSAIETTDIADVVFNGDCFADTSSGDLGCYGSIETFHYASVAVDQPGGGTAMLFVVRSLRIAQAGQLHVYGGAPAIFFALDTMKIDGAITGVAAAQTPAGAFEQDSTGHGGGPGGGEPLLGYNGGGGGSYCGIGGKGGLASGTTPPKGGKSYGTPDLVPLIGGSSGGGGATVDNSGGTGGPAIELAAGRSLTISLTGVINVGGLGGRANGGAGGSGGALLLEAPTVAVHGTLAANGGGGAVSNGGSSGQSGQPGDSPALGSEATAGQGSAAAVVNGGDGSLDNGSVNSSGGGGGGAGRIRINTATGKADLSGAIISPPPTTPCTTEGKIG
jgi:hypothetical protein